MTREEFQGQFGRLCEGHRYDPTVKQTEAFYEFLQYFEPDDLRVAVTKLLAAVRFPSTVDQIIRECEFARETRKRAAAIRERQEAAAFLGGKLFSKRSDAMEGRYFDARLKLLSSVFNADGTTKAIGCAAKVHAEGLAELIADQAMGAWMRETNMGTCHRHTGDHSVFDCLVDEWKYWVERSNGKSACEAYRAINAIARAPLDAVLMVRVDSYGNVLADQRGTVEAAANDPGPSPEAIGEASR